MPQHINWVSGVVIFLCLLSLFFLSHLAFNQSQRIMQSSKYRFTCFLIQHLVLISFMVCFVMKKQMYDLVKWGFALSSVLSITGTITELLIHFMNYSNKIYSIMTVMPVELAYMNCYFLIYMYSLIACVLTGLFLFFTNCCIWFQMYRIKKCIKESIWHAKYDSTVGGQQCSICITQLTDEEPLLQIKCKHIFHQECLLEWIRRNQTCPTCRYKIFQALQDQEIGIQVEVEVIQN